MERRDVNPWEWSKAFGYSQAIDLTRPEQLVFCSGQTPAGPDGAPPSTSDMGEQMRAAIANLTTVLEAAGMTMGDVIKLTVYTTEMDAALADWAIVTEALSPNLPASTLVGVTRLAFPELKIEIDATAAR